MCCALSHFPLLLSGQQLCVHDDGVCEVQRVQGKKESGGASYDCGHNMGYVGACRELRHPKLLTMYITVFPSVFPILVVMLSILPDHTNYISDEL